MGSIAETPTDDAKDATTAPTAMSNDGDAYKRESHPLSRMLPYEEVLGRCAQSTAMSLVFEEKRGDALIIERSQITLLSDG